MWPSGHAKYEYQMKRGANGVYKRNGWFKAYYEDGTVEREGNYRDEKRVGVWHFYDATGKLTQTTDYGPGKP